MKNKGRNERSYKEVWTTKYVCIVGIQVRFGITEEEACKSEGR